MNKNSSRKKRNYLEFNNIDLENSNDIYEVEEIVGKRTKKGKVFYQVKWEGYSSKENTWEPPENLVNILDKIQEFEEKKNKSKSCSVKNSIRDDSSVADSEKLPPTKNELLKKYENYGVKSMLQASDLPEILEKGIENYNSNEIGKMINFKYIGNIQTDTPLKIKYARVSCKKLWFMIQWERRSDGILPQESLVEHKIIKEMFPYILISFYESNLRSLNLKYVNN